MLISVLFFAWAHLLLGGGPAVPSIAERPAGQLILASNPQPSGALATQPSHALVRQAAQTGQVRTAPQKPKTALRTAQAPKPQRSAPEMPTPAPILPTLNSQPHPIRGGCNRPRKFPRKWPLEFPTFKAKLDLHREASHERMGRSESNQSPFE
jgi:hypothetical protein